MKLSELSPRWVGITGENYVFERRNDQCLYGVGFLCPCCKTQRLVVLFKPFIDPTNLADIVPWLIPGSPDPNTGIAKEVRWWHRTGETFNDLTLTPSIDVTHLGHWHGFISQGVIK